MYEYYLKFSEKNTYLSFGNYVLNAVYKSYVI